MSVDEQRALAGAFDPNRLDRAFYENPYPVYAALRSYDPVHRCPDGTYFLSRYADLDRIYRDRTAFSSDKKQAFAPKFGVGSPLYEHHTTSLVFNDAPYHTRVRRQIVGALTPHVLKAMEPDVVALVDTLLDRMEAQRDVDLITDYAAAVRRGVGTCGVPRDRGPRAAGHAILGALEPSLTARN